MFGFFGNTAPAPPPPEPNILLYLFLFWIMIKFIDKHKSTGKNTRKVKEWREETVSSPLDDVVGLEGVKEEIKYYMDFINNESKYTKWGVKLPKGILLAGPPGTGKTLLVKTMAKTLDIPIISEAGSSFVEMYVGVGAKRVRELFKKAKGKGRCIIFIDELDAVGTKRNLENNSERASTLNQLLVEMDGFDMCDGIMVFAATNLVKYLDPALLRSGRFDKKIYFDHPNFSERKSMFEMYLKDIIIPTESNSSIKIMHLPLPLAFLNRSRTLLAPTPTYISTNELPASLIMGISRVLAIVLTSKVFPVPGGPAKRIPLGNLTPHLVYLLSLLIKSI